LLYYPLDPIKFPGRSKLSYYTLKTILVVSPCQYLG